MIKIEVITFDAKGVVIKTQNELFKTDKESITFLEGIHFEKMNTAAQNAGLKKYTEALITRPAKWPSFNGQRESTRNYRDLEKCIQTSLKINISHV